MNKLKDVIKDILYVSKLTVKNKKIIITTSIALSQLTAATDLALIAVFAAVIAKQFTNIEFVNIILNYFIEYKVLLATSYDIFQLFTVCNLKKNRTRSIS